MSTRERKVVTVLFADLVGFTSAAEQLDPEDVAEILQPYHERLRSELERWGGTVEKFIGDAVMALFGAPVTREDDPERAVRAALAIRDWIAEEGKLEVRIAINTGEALVRLDARPEAGEGMAAGDIINTTARLQSAAPVNGILAGETTYRATAGTIDYREHPAVEAKGKARPVEVWEVVAARARFGTDLAPTSRAPLIGRDRELDQLAAALQRAKANSSTELVTLVGVAGMGKSRLVGELFQALEQGEQELVYWRQGRSLPYGDGVSYWALAEIVKAHAGILDTDGEAVVEQKLARAVDETLDDDVEWVHSHLRPLVGRVDETVTRSRDEAFAAWRRFFEALAERHPLVLVFEDLQWADDELLDFIEHLADWVKGVPVLLLCTARLELLERRPAWGGGKVNSMTMSLAPLSSEQTAQLLGALSERSLLVAETQSALLERAGGNPLYAEQYVRMLEERQTIEDLPESVQGIIGARLDALPADEKRLLQSAAVVGKVFWLGAVDATERDLHALEQKEFVQRARRSSVEGEMEFSFKHVLVRDVAYGQIPRAERAEKHVRTAEWIESLGRPEDHAEMLAHHYVSALEFLRDRDSALAARASAALRDAGDRAYALSAIPQALQLYRQALELTSADDAERARILLRLGRALVIAEEGGEDELAAARDGLLAADDPEGAAEASLALSSREWLAGRSEASAVELQRALSLVEDLPLSRTRVEVLCNIARTEAIGGVAERALELATEALARAEELDLDALRSHALNSLAIAYTDLGDGRAVETYDESIAVASRAQSITDVVRGHNNLIPYYGLTGELAEARAREQLTLDIARRYGHLSLVRFVEEGAAIAHRYLAGEWDDALERADAVLARSEQSGRSYNIHATYMHRGLIRLARGDTDGAVSDAEQAIALARPIRDPQAVQPTRAVVGAIFQSAGKTALAEELLDEALVTFRSMRGFGFAIVESPLLGWIAATAGKGDEFLDAVAHESRDSPWLRAARATASYDFSAAARIFGQIGMPPHDAFFRLRAAERLVDEGRRAEADAELAPALSFYRSVGATFFLRQAEALLAESA